MILCCVQNDAKEGFGVLQYKNGERYEVSVIFPYLYTYLISKFVIQGQWKANLANGQGKLSYADGDHYVGEWKDGKKSGYGELFYTNQDRFRLDLIFWSGAL